MIDIRGQVKLLAMNVLDVAHKVDRIEVSSGSHHLHVLLVGWIDLIALKNLRR